MSQKAFYYFFIYVMGNIILLFLAFGERERISVVDWISVIQIIMTIVLSILIYGRIVSVFNIFILLTYLFHFGQALIRIFPFEDRLYDRSVLTKVGSDILINAEQFGILCIFTITLGYAIFYNKYKEESDVISMRYYRLELSRIKKIAKVIFVISVFPMLYIDLLKLFALAAGGYESTYLVYQNGIGKYIGLIGQFCKPVFPLLIYCNKDRIKRATFLFAVFSLYLLLIMISGDRGTSMIYIVTNLFVYFAFVKRIRFKIIVIGAILAYFGLGLISAVSLFRYGEFTLAGLIAAFQFRSSDGIIYSTLREFGGTMITLAHSITYVPSYSSWGGGLTYIVSMLFVSPWLPNAVVEKATNYVSFTHVIPSVAIDYVSLGGSFLGEAFYNFGYFAPVFLVFLGAFIKKIDKAFQSERNVRRVAIFIVLLPALFLWVRDFYVNLIFKTFWIGIVILYVKVGYNEKNTITNNG